MRNVQIVGIAGGSASGKSTILEKCKEHFNDEIEVLCHDFYYKAHDELTLEERSKLNYDHPEAFETDRMIQDIIRLIRGEEVQRPEYDYTIHNRSDKSYLVKPKPVIIVDGCLVLENKELRNLMDLKIFIDVDSDERLMRRIVRDVAHRGRTLESVLTQYRETVKPMHEAFVEPSKKYADLIIPRGGENEVAVDIMIQQIKAMLKRTEQ